MQTRKIVIIILTGFILRVIVSCCNCDVTNEFTYTFDSVQLYHINNSGQTPVIVDNGTVPKEAYGLRLDFSLGQLSYNKSLNFSAFNTVCAFDCECPPDFQYLAHDTISKIKVITLNVFDNTHPANSEISNYFKVLNNNSYLTIQEYLNFPETIYYEKPKYEIVELYLLQLPLNIGEFRFKIEILLSNGTTYTSTTNVINLE